MKKGGVKGEARAHILKVADDLFYRQGIRAVGVDTIVAQSGVAKTTLYDHFSSKDALIDAYLEGQDQIFWETVDSALSRHPDSPRQQFVDLFEGFEALIASPGFTGCPFLSVTGEFPEVDQPGHRVALAHKQKMRARFQELTRLLGVVQADQLADQLMLVLDGAFASKRVYRTTESPALQLKSAALLLLEGHLSHQ